MVVSAHLFDSGTEFLLTRSQRLKISLFGRVCLGWFKKPGWSGYIRVYAFKCRVHGYVANQTRGGKGTVICPLCAKETRQ